MLKLKRVITIFVLSFVIIIARAVLNYGTIPILFLLSFAFFIAFKWNYTIVAIKTFPRDFRALFRFLSLQLTVYRHSRSNDTVNKIFNNNVSKYRTKPAFIFDTRRWSFEEVNKYAKSVANHFYLQGYRKGDVVGILLENRPEVIGLYLGLGKIGVIAALINFNVTSEQLIHCLNVSDAKGIIYSRKMGQEIFKLLHGNGCKYDLYSLDSVDGKGDGYDPSPNGVCSPTGIRLEDALSNSPIHDPPNVHLGFRDKLLLIFTSGTTGLPKAAIITHGRYLYMVNGVRKTLAVRPDDVIYDVLPLYHVAGTILGCGQAVVGGATVVIAKKFSASRFWDDCIKYRCTVAQYIGEICRYLLNQPKKPQDTEHRIRLMYGNGVRPEIWRPFKDRFKIPQIGEFYGSTEGNCNLVNIFNKPGAVGFVSRIIPWAYPVILVRVDEDTGEPLRDYRGVCLKAKPGEVGELVGKISPRNPMRQFDGYVNKAASDKKIIKDVFSKGDMAFRTGDLLEMDEMGYMYFRDRTGDTFRWKGENVSTMEVEGVVSRSLGHRESVVYGVHVFEMEGQAGMAAILGDPKDIDMFQLEQNLQQSLPSYARPVFLRFCECLDKTGTFKLQKTGLRKSGFDPNQISDPLYYFNTNSCHYDVLTSHVYTLLSKGALRL